MRACAASAVGLDRHQESEVQRCLLRRDADWSGDGQHRASADAEGLSRSRQRSKATLEPDLPAAKRVFEQLKSLGIDFKEITDELTQEGVKAFADSFRSLLCAQSRRSERSSPSDVAAAFGQRRRCEVRD